MKSSEIRQSFLGYFEGKGHRVVPSSSLVPDDPTLLLVNAGMVQFKNLFLGRESRDYNRAATAQKCARLSGKHNDIEEVGPSPRHHTFFEMMGNFSFGDYFKDEAIQYAWEYVTQILKLDPDKLSATVFEDDDEAIELWLKHSSLPKERIFRLGKESNWWSMGDTGPNGPCSEIYYDRGADECTCSRNGACTVQTAEEDEACDRFWEFWNLVFMQFHTHSDGSTTPLENPSVDTGMGLERVTAILQNAKTNYETDLFQPIFKATQQLTGHSDQELKANEIPYRVIADHGRAMTFLIADGVVPGNEDRSYVLRMLIRRALRFGMKLGLTDPFLTTISDVVINEMGTFYPELKARRDFIAEAIGTEEEKFSTTFNSRMEGLDKLFKQMKSQGESEISGEAAFFLHDTHGFHVQIIEDIAKERGFTVNKAAYEAEMEKQRERSRVETDDESHSLDKLSLDDFQPTSFIGNEHASGEAEVLFVAKDSHGHLLALFNETPFYAQSGGQVADTGVIENLSQTGSGRILNVEKNPAGHFIHTLEVSSGSFTTGDRCRLLIDAQRRRAIERNHTGTHILHAALRKVLDHETGIQAGSLVSENELRFDFTHFSPLKPEEISKIEDLANGVILRDLPVVITEEGLEEAKSRGAMALFEEDYQGKAKVRVVEIASESDNEPSFSIELCGGTHVKRTGEIGLFKLIHEEGVASGIRRVYVATGENSLSYLREREQLITNSAQLLKAAPTELPQRIETLIQQRSELERELKAATSASLVDVRDEIMGEAEAVDGCQLLFKSFSLEIDELKELADLVDEQLSDVILLFGTDHNHKATLVAKVSESLTKRVRAGDLVREAAQLVGGKGGGNPRFAQGGGDQPEKLEEALNAVRQSLIEKLNS